VQWTHSSSTETTLRQLKASGYRIYAIEQSASSISLETLKPDPDNRYALVFGNEVKGVDPQLIPLLDGCIEIPQSGIKHSLNIAVCAGIVLWKFYETTILKKA
jgi:tRNA G18 (ribose-2'-O)-methylase SpoU